MMLSIQEIHSLLVKLNDCGPQLGGSLVQRFDSKLQDLVKSFNSETLALVKSATIYMRMPKNEEALGEINKRLGELLVKAHEIFELDRNKDLAGVLKSYNELMTQRCYSELFVHALHLGAIRTNYNEDSYYELSWILTYYEYNHSNKIEKALKGLVIKCKPSLERAGLGLSDFADRTSQLNAIVDLTPASDDKVLRKTPFSSRRWNNLMDSYNALRGEAEKEFLSLSGDRYLLKLPILISELVKIAYDILLETNHPTLLLLCKEFMKWIIKDGQNIQNIYNGFKVILSTQQKNGQVSNNYSNSLKRQLEINQELTQRNDELKTFQASALKVFGVFKSVFGGLEQKTLTQSAALGILSEATKKINFDPKLLNRHAQPLPQANNSVPDEKQICLLTKE